MCRCGDTLSQEGKTALAGILSDICRALDPDDPASVVIGPVDFGPARDTARRSARRPQRKSPRRPSDPGGTERMCQTGNPVREDAIAMGETTAISWTDHTFNPWMGCTNVSPGCDHCYAEALGKRTGKVQWGDDAKRIVTSDGYWRNPIKWNATAEDVGRQRARRPNAPRVPDPALRRCLSGRDEFSADCSCIGG